MKISIPVTLAMLLCGAGSAQAASPADWLYEPTTINEIRLELPPSSYKTLEEHPEDEYVPGTFSIAETNGTPGSTGPFSTPIEVGIRLKGGLGSLRSINEKAAFKIKFDTVVKGQTFLGLEKMTLNNMVQDESMIAETLAYQAFRALGVAAPHVGFTYLTVNGKSYGLHLNIETQDVNSLEKAFGPFLNPPQHLYEGEYGADVSSEMGKSKPKWEELEVQEGKKKEKGDLMALLAAVEGSTGTFSERVANFADLAEMTRMWMVEKYIGHWDGYSGRTPDLSQPNNYFLFSDAAGKFKMLPWGTDQTWEVKLKFGDPGGVLFNDCKGDAAGCWPLYLSAGQEALTKLNALELDTTARCTAAALLPWREYEVAQSEPEKLPPYGLAATAAAVKSARSFIAARPAELASFLGTSAPPKPTEELACPPLRRISGPTTAPVTGSGSAAAPEPASRRLTLGRRIVGARAIAIQVQLPAAGRVFLKGTAGPKGATIEACAGHGRADAAGPETIKCRLRPWLLGLLDEKAVWLHLSATFTPPSGSPQTSSTSLRLPRRQRGLN